MTSEEFAAAPLYKRVRHVRKEILGMTQVEFAAEVGVKDRTVKGWENPAQSRGAPDEANAETLARLSGYPARLFMSPPPLETTIAEEISRKLDLLLVHLALGRPMPAAEVEGALARLEQRVGDAGRSGLVGSPSGGDGP